ALATVPPSLLAHTVQTALLGSPGRAAALAEGVLRTTLFTKEKWATLLFLIVSMFGLGAGLLGRSALADKPPAGQPATSQRPQRSGTGTPSGAGNRIPDFQKQHKYGIAAKQAVDWDKRRDFTYSIRTVLRVMRPYNLKAMQDDYQDVRVLARHK